MSSLKKDITQILANLYSQAYADGAVGHSRNDDILTAHKEIINLIESVMDEVSADLGEILDKYAQDYHQLLRTPTLEAKEIKERKKDQAISDIKSKLIDGSKNNGK